MKILTGSLLKNINIKIRTVLIPMGSFGWQPQPGRHQPSSKDMEGEVTDAAPAPVALRLVGDTRAGQITGIQN